jgi:hypothetical protein
MNFLRLAMAILFAVCAQCSYADSIHTFQITQATMQMGPNDGSGDNLSFTFTGPGLTITGIGGMGCIEWCSGQPIYDLSSVGTSQIFITGFTTATIGGISYDPNTLAFASLFDAFGGLNASTTGFVGEGDTFTQFRITAPTNGGWNLNFAYVQANGDTPAYYYFTDGEFSANARVVTPEPGTVSLMLVGLAGIAGIAKRKVSYCRNPRA